MNNQDLMYFCKLVESGSYTKTAKYFKVTQPTISAAIKRLATHFKDPLVSQVNRKSKLTTTAAGALLYQKATHLLQEIHSIDHDILHASERKIRISFSGVAGSIYIPEIIAQFYRAGIMSMLDTHLERSADIFNSLTNGDIDVAIYSWMVPINDPSYYIRTLNKTELVIITGLDDPWATKNEVRVSELRNRNFIARSTGYLTRECLDQEANLGNFTPNIIFTARTMQLMIDLVRKNVGIALAMEDTLTDLTDLHVIHLIPEQRLWAYSQIAMRKSFVPNEYQQKGIDILRNFHAI
ncbi:MULTISPECIES: LysR family transcriptional regulator [Lactobacillus]|uniref:LysR family transcriptional regulator n=1 Tax=Lactobacillus xujianguonis TaxID=2495899 RepID=A0A437SW80_9LACO|nr:MULTISPECIES: LysR family transcriptional regulator [Lactobacillus]RVU71110.1 LysR family transcriptional regulator [Lactobacillus xujianguonis]RVU77458.1 LysR family transcriptional regulator [Lactobacillus xujianguonis]